MRARRSPPPTKWTGNGATAQSCPHSRAFRFRSRTYSTKLASPRWPGRQCWLARRQRRGTRAHALPEWNVPRIRDQPIDRPALNLVGRPRPLILRPDSRACARTRCRSEWIVEGHNWSGVGWDGVGRGPVNCYTREVWRRSRSPASSARQTPSIAAGTWTATRSMPSSSTAPMRAAQPVADEGRQLPDGAHGGTDERRRFLGHL